MLTPDQSDRLPDRRYDQTGTTRARGKSAKERGPRIHDFVIFATTWQDVPVTALFWSHETFL